MSEEHAVTVRDRASLPGAVLLLDDPVEPASNIRHTAAARVILAVVIACHIALVWAARIPGVMTGQDDAEYILLGRALSHGSYRELWRVDEPVHSQYPPGFPAVLGAWEIVAGPSQAARVMLVVISSAGMLLLLYGAIRRRFGTNIALASVVVLAVNPFFVQYGGEIASEMPYTFLSVLCLYGLIRSEDARNSKHSRVSDTWILVAIAAAVIAALMRTVGITLIAAVGIWLVLNRRWKQVAELTVASTLTLGAWLLWTVLAPEQFVGRSYVADALVSPDSSLWFTLGRRVVRNALLYVQGLLWLVAAPTIAGTLIDNIVALLVVGISGVTGFVVLWRRWRAAALYAVVYMCLLLAFSWNLTRYLVPMLVVAVPVIFVGAVALTRSFSPPYVATTLVVLVILMAWGGAGRSAKLVAANNCPRGEGIPVAECSQTPEQQKYFEALRYIDSNLPHDAVLLTVKSGALYYYTGRKSISAEAARRRRPEDFIAWIKNQGAEYVLLSAVDDSEVRFFSMLLQTDCDRLQLIRSFGSTALLFTVGAPVGQTGTGAACQAIGRYRDLLSERYRNLLEPSPERRTK